MKKFFAVLSIVFLVATIAEAKGGGGGGGIVALRMDEPVIMSKAEIRNGEAKVVEALKSYGCESIKIVSNKLTKVASKRAIMSGVEFDITAVKGGETNKLSVFYGKHSGAIILFKGKDRILLE